MLRRPALLVPATLACVAALAPIARARPAVGVTAGTTLVRFDTSTSGSTTLPLTGLQPGESIVGLDVRPATGELLGLGRIDQGATSDLRVYRIDAETGAAAVVGNGSPVSRPDAPGWGFDVNPVPDRIRIVTSTDGSARLNPDTGALAASDTDLSPAARFVEAVAYDANNPLLPTVSTAFAITRLGDLARIGGPGGVPSANGGVLTTVGPLGLSFPAAGQINLDIAPDGVAYMTYPALVGGGPQIATVNLTTGAATLVRSLEQPLTGFAIRTPVTISAATTVSESDGAAILTAERPATGDVATIDVGTADGTATAPADYLASTGPLVFPPGVTSRAIVVPIRPDAVVEGPETLTVTASAPHSLSLPTSVSRVVTITDVPPVATAPPPAGAGPPSALKVLLLAPAGSSRRGVSAGLRTEVACTAACGATVDLRLGRTSVARGSAALTAAGTRVVRLKATRAGSAALARTLRRRPSVALRARGTFTATGAASQVVTRTVRVSR